MRARMCPKRPLAVLASGLLGASAAVLVSCGSSGKLIPVANSEPLQRDFQEVATAAENAHGSCASTEATVAKAQQDLNTLPSSVDAGLRHRLTEGLAKLRSDALELCAQPAAGTTATTAPRTTTTPPSTATSTTTTPTTTPETTPTSTNTTTSPGGGTVAPKEGEGESAGKRKDGGAEPEAGGGAPPAGGQEGGK